MQLPRDYCASFCLRQDLANHGGSSSNGKDSKDALPRR